MQRVLPGRDEHVEYPDVHQPAAVHRSTRVGLRDAGLRRERRLRHFGHQLLLQPQHSLSGLDRLGILDLRRHLRFGHRRQVQELRE